MPAAEKKEGWEKKVADLPIHRKKKKESGLGKAD